MSSIPFIRSPYNYDRDAVSQSTGLACEDPSLAQQQFKEDADINTIVRRFGITGELPTGPRMPSYGDFQGIFDFQSAQNLVVQAQASFAALPAEVRDRFANDPAQFIAFAEDRSNLGQMRAWGLAPEALPAVAEAASAAKV